MKIVTVLKMLTVTSSSLGKFNLKIAKGLEKDYSFMLLETFLLVETFVSVCIIFK